MSISLDKLRQHFSQNRELAEISTTGFEAAAVLILIYPGLSQLEVVLTRRSDQMPTHAGQISFPGGRVEDADNDHIETALREAYEEIGLERQGIEILGQLETSLLPSGFAVTPVVAIADSAPELSANLAEVAEIFAMPLSIALNPALYKSDSMVRNKVIREFYYIDYKEYYIWGATAKMLYSLALELYDAEEG